MVEIDTADIGKTASFPMYLFMMWIFRALKWKANRLELHSFDDWRTVTGSIIVDEGDSFSICCNDPSTGTSLPFEFDRDCFLTEIVQKIGSQEIILLRIDDKPTSVHVTFISPCQHGEEMRLDFGADLSGAVVDRILEKVVFDFRNRSTKGRSRKVIRALRVLAPLWVTLIIIIAALVGYLALVSW